MANPFLRRARELAARALENVEATGPATAAGASTGVERWLPALRNPDQRGLPLFEVRGGLVYPTVDNPAFDGYSVDAVFELRGTTAWPTLLNTQVPHGYAYYELRDGQVFPTVDNRDDPYGVALFDIV